MDGNLLVEVEVEQARTRIGEREYELSRGERLELPEAAAAFVVLKGWARLISP